ncbi:MAG: thioester reductase domain-containing protein, partial [Pirellulaceae bacterium]
HARFVAALEEICRRPFIPVSQAMPQDKIVARLATHSAADMSDRAGAVVTPAAERRTMPAASLFAGGGDTNYLAEARLDPSIEAPAGAIVDPSRRDRVFLTGATGFLGAFLLDDLLRMTDSRVYCLVRATSESKARDRILDNLARYRLHPAGVKERVVPIVGDLAEPRFGLSPEEFEQLGEQIDVIYHNGAIVNLVYPYPLLRRANVAGTEEVLRLATTGRLKPTHHVSTFWVQAADDGTHRQVVTEDDPLPPCEGLPIGYSRSKWVGEQMIAEARRRGIPVSIYRPGYVTGDSRTGVCNADDFLHAIVLACAQVRSVPQLDMNLEITPVDFVSRAIVQLSLQPQYLGNTYHLVNPHPLPLTMLADWMQTMGMKIRPVSYATWRSQLSELARGAPDELIAPLMSLLGPGDGVNPGWHPRYDCRRATEHLAESHIVCPPADDRLLATYHAYLREAGFLWDEPAASPRPVAGAMAAELRGSDVR